MRQLRLTNKKLRGIPRRLRALKRWSENFIDYFPDELPKGRQYMNWKIPVHAGLVMGKYSTPKIKAECAQRMIEACANLIHAKPIKFKNVRVTALISLPDMFSSEICLYLDEAYFRGHTLVSGETKLICDFSERCLHFWIFCLQTKTSIFRVVKDEKLTAKPHSP